MAAHRGCVNARIEEGLSLLNCASDAPDFDGRGLSKSGAGEGNRTLVVSLEGFCSTIELHPPADAPCHCLGEGVNRLAKVDDAQVLPLPRDSHDEPDRHRRFLDCSPLLVARCDSCGAMARLIG